MERNLFTKEPRPPSDPTDPPLSYTYIYDITKLAYTYMEHSTLQHYIKRRSLYTPRCVSRVGYVCSYNTISTPAPAFPPRNDGAIAAASNPMITSEILSLFLSAHSYPLFSFFFLLLRLHCKICTTLRPAVAAELVRTGGSPLFHAL